MYITKVIAFFAVSIILLAGIFPNIVYESHEKVRITCYEGTETREKEIDHSTANLIKQMVGKIRNGGEIDAYGINGENGFWFSAIILGFTGII